MERLTKRLATGTAISKLSQCQNTPLGTQEIIDKLAAYEDAEEQGLLVRLPCKQGDYVYFIKSSFSYAKTPMKYRIIGFRKYAEGEIVTYVCVNDYGRNRTFTSHDIGKTVFLTCEDAEQALKEVHHEQS